MYFIYLWEVLKRAFTATPRLTDALQILAASAVPAVGTVFGITLPAETPALVLAYIGMAALAFFVIRLFWAPYSIWKDHGAEIGGLKLELSKPERLILARLAKHRAKARVKLMQHLVQMGLDSCRDADQGMARTLAKTTYKAISAAHAAGYGRNVRGLIIDYSTICEKDPENEFCDRWDAEESLLAFVNGDITFEAAERRLLPYTESERLL
ncbi:MAG: hypothetical protein ACTHLU_01210 [Novosphingobium sp.]